MILAAGSKLGPYEIVAPLGAGGMGEVYRAKDTRLDRSVAIKISIRPAALTAEVLYQRRMKRFPAHRQSSERTNRMPLRSIRLQQENWLPR